LLGFYPEDGDSTFLRNISEQHDVTTQNLILFIVTAVRTPEYLESIFFAKCLFVCSLFNDAVSNHTIH
jgi:hypothetical protein